MALVLGNGESSALNGLIIYTYTLDICTRYDGKKGCCAWFDSSLCQYAFLSPNNPLPTFYTYKRTISYALWILIFYAIITYVIIIIWISPKYFGYTVYISNSWMVVTHLFISCVIFYCWLVFIFKMVHLNLEQVWS